MGYGGVTVLNEVQKVNLSPLNQLPSIKTNTSTLSNENSFFEKINTNNLNIASNADLENLYRPTELILPLLTPRDGPISAIDPSSSGVYAQGDKSLIDLEIETSTFKITQAPQVTEKEPKAIYVIAQKPAWVRIFEPNGNILFENILDTGQRYKVPKSAKSAMLRAGNSGFVYLMIGDDFYGPLGTSTGVAKKVNLQSEMIIENYELAKTNLTFPLNRPINNKVIVQSID